MIIALNGTWPIVNNIKQNLKNINSFNSVKEINFYLGFRVEVESRKKKLNIKTINLLNYTNCIIWPKLEIALEIMYHF